MAPMTPGTDRGGDSMDCAIFFDKPGCMSSTTCTWNAGLNACLTRTGGPSADSICFKGCDNIMKGDGVCHEACNNYLCDYDGGDCGTGAWSGNTAGLRTGLCAPGCYAVLLNNGQCDTACAGLACGFDGDDCCHRTYTSGLKIDFIADNHKGSTYTGDLYPRVTPDMSKQSLDRFVGRTNKLIAGVLIEQKRTTDEACGTGNLFTEVTVHRNSPLVITPSHFGRFEKWCFRSHLLFLPGTID